MPDRFARLFMPATAIFLTLLGAFAGGCSATSEETPSRRNDNGTGAAANSSGGSTGAGGNSSSAGTAGVSSAGGTGSSIGGSGSAGTPAGTAGTSQGQAGGPVVHPPADLTLPYLEDFEDGEAQGWMDSFDEEEAPLGTWAIVDDGTKVYRLETPTDDESWAVGGDYRWTDQHLETKIKVVSGAEEAFIILAVRLSTLRSYYFVEITSDRIKLRDGGTDSTVDLGEFDIEPPFVDGEVHTFGLSAVGSALTVYYEGAPVITGTSTTALAGGIGLAARDAVVSFDDVSVTAE